MARRRGGDDEIGEGVREVAGTIVTVKEAVAMKEAARAGASTAWAARARWAKAV